ncbi:hypothetical protein SDRG_04500 [Saprolegnia diclina VS20]|uniref:Uncharacterized protein n=1 Tax=Saprolegnia diclina (strain VS20) TaxID=1156394 RepID=T0QVM9_SAPDV|nr:hypothetical protein SDRG_04500 [Saprolegnia diclina VS20]EQC38070.1 hypothetical protein SDRG_04500 [Saprolegnia diclina VS20]|eukprot:XP_008608397.1 hypothetical protein SDRG_04500 [Saprolegnia diclina VS20]
MDHETPPITFTRAASYVVDLEVKERAFMTTKCATTCSRAKPSRFWTASMFMYNTTHCTTQLLQLVDASRLFPFALLEHGKVKALERKLNITPSNVSITQVMLDMKAVYDVVAGVVPDVDSLYAYFVNLERDYSSNNNSVVGNFAHTVHLLHPVLYTTIHTNHADNNRSNVSA